MDLFDYMREASMEKESPLASRLRPATLDEIVGQEHIIGKDKLLYRAIKADKISSVIFYGPPGTGKTTIAKVIANTTSAQFKQINATSAGKKDMEQVIGEAKSSLGMYGKKTILFVDEIHRFNKGQQDYLLPFVEDGTVILIGATTENPYFEVNSALLSRSIIFELKPLSEEAIKTLLTRAVYDVEKGMGAYHAVITEEALDFIADVANGDARAALNAVEIGIMTTKRSADGKIHIDLATASECIQKRVIKYDKEGDNHYDTISAFIKSMRGSDPDAAVYYLARMLYAGEQVTFVARRIMICAAEDVGNADPQALGVAVNAALAAERVGMPEAQIILAQAAAYVACAPKSNSAVNAIGKAMDYVGTHRTAPVPAHLRDSHYKGAAKLGRGAGYAYAHDYPNHYVNQQYLPDTVVGEKFYELGDLGYEKQLKAHMEALRAPYAPVQSPHESIPSTHEPAQAALPWALVPKRRPLIQLYIMRHGRTVWNADGKIQGSADIELTEEGREGAGKTGDAFRAAGLHFDRIYSSPLERAYETAGLVGGYTGLEICRDDRLRELSFGILEGQSVEHIQDSGRYPKQGCFFTQPEAYERPAQGESLEELCMRAKDFLEELFDSCREGERILITAHGAMNKALMAVLKGTPIKAFWDGKLQKNCGVNVVVTNGCQYMILEEGKVFY